jgi:hypothetical protein
MMDIHQQQQQQQEQQSSASEQCRKVVVVEQLDYQEAASHDNDCGEFCTSRCITTYTRCIAQANRNSSNQMHIPVAAAVLCCSSHQPGHVQPAPDAAATCQQAQQHSRLRRPSAGR